MIKVGRTLKLPIKGGYTMTPRQKQMRFRSIIKDFAINLAISAVFTTCLFTFLAIGLFM